MQRNVSGQFLFFDLVSVLSGYSVTGFSGAISGRKLIDSNPMALLSGNIIEVSGGMYRANLYDFDTDGNNIGYFFTASGCVPRSFNVITDRSLSGRIYLAPGSISGTNVIVPVANLSGVVPNIVSGTVFLGSGSIGSGTINSGVFVTATASVASGGVYLASGHFLFGSGQYFIASGSIGSGTINSGVFVTATATVGSGVVFLASGHFLFGSGQFYLNSGQRVNVYSGQLSGFTMQPMDTNGSTTLRVNTIQIDTEGAAASLLADILNGTGGTLYADLQGQVLSGTFIVSGQMSGHRIDLLSGRSYTASGINTVSPIASGSIFPASGMSVLVYSGQLSGHQVDLLSGRSYTASGINTVSPIASGSIYVASGTSVLVHSGQLSGHVVDLLSGRSYTASGIFATATATVSSGTIYLASGHFLFGSGQYFLNSGQSVLVYSGQLSGHAPNLLSGYSFLASGIQTVAASVLDKSGYVLTSGGLDQIQVESGVNIRQAQSLFAATLGGRLSGAGTTSIRFDGANVSGTNRVIATVDASGNRTVVSLALPS